MRARIARGLIPFRICASILSANSCLTARTDLFDLIIRLQSQSAMPQAPCLQNKRPIALLLRDQPNHPYSTAPNAGLPCNISSIIGFRLDSGMRASNSSITTSISFSFSSICLLALGHMTWKPLNGHVTRFSYLTHIQCLKMN